MVESSQIRQGSRCYCIRLCEQKNKRTQFKVCHNPTLYIYHEKKQLTQCNLVPQSSNSLVLPSLIGSSSSGLQVTSCCICSRGVKGMCRSQWGQVQNVRTHSLYKSLESFIVCRHARETDSNLDNNALVNFNLQVSHQWCFTINCLGH